MSAGQGQRHNRPLRERETSGLTRERLRLELRRALPGLSLLLGLAMTAAIAGAFILAKIGAPTPFRDVYELRVAVDDAKGVIPGAQEVRLAGVPVGKITGIDLVDGGPVLKVSIAGRYAPLYRDAKLRLRPQTPLQDMYLNVEDRGSAEAGELAEGQTLAAERTRTPVDISSVMNVFDEPTRTRLERMIDEFGRGLGDDGDQLRAAFVEIVPFLHAAQRLTDETATRREATKRMVHNLRRVVDELGRRDRQLTGLIAAGSATFAELRSTGQPLDRLLAELPPTLSRLRTSSETVDSALNELDPALVALQPTADALDPALRSLTALSREARPAFRSLRRVTAHVLPLTEATLPLARNLEGAFAGLEPSAPRLDRVTEAIMDCRHAVTKFFQWTPSVFKLGDANGAAPRGAAASYAPGQLVAGPSCAGGKP